MPPPFLLGSATMDGGKMDWMTGGKVRREKALDFNG